jgi:choline dehydrogenase
MSDAEFDYVVVGAGSAGSVLAEGLSRGGKYSVAVIEAGGSDRRFFVQMPLGYGKTFFDKTINWNYHAEPDPGLNGQSDFWPRGKIVGGSGSINAMVWIRGDARDYDDWAAEGNAGWSFADVLPFFKGLEDNQAGASELRGTGGPVHITDASPFAHPLAKRFVKAATEAGFDFNPDFNGPVQEGVGIYQINSKNGWRMSAAKAFLRPALKRGNVKLYLHTQALKVLISGKRAVGVEVETKGVRHDIRARREVVLAGGSINSPQLLQLSGIGPGAHLQSLGIEVIADNAAIGHHMQDHLGINYVFKANIPTLNQVLRPWWGKMRAGMEFLLAGRGPLSLSMNQGGGFVKSRPSLERPDTQLYFQAISTFSAKKGTRPLLVPDPYPGFALGVSNTRPTARGTCLIRSTDPFAAPAIHANAFGTDSDMQDMLESVKVIRRIAAQPALSDIIVEELQPGPSVTSDEAMMHDFRSRSGTVYHPCGTVRMGDDAATSAVDGRLRVRGVEGLRVADASVFPTVISGNTNAPTMMVASRAVSMMLEDAGS